MVECIELKKLRIDRCVAGYIVSRHMKAIADTGNILVAALDKRDSIWMIDSYFPDASFL